MKFKKYFKKHFHAKPENIILVFGALLLAFRLFFPVLQCKVESIDKTICPKGVVAFYSLGPDINYHFHKERTYTQSFAIGAVTIALYIAAKSKRKGLFK